MMQALKRVQTTQYKMSISRSLMSQVLLKTGDKNFSSHNTNKEAFFRFFAGFSAPLLKLGLMFTINSLNDSLKRNKFYCASTEI